MKPISAVLLLWGAGRHTISGLLALSEPNDIENINIGIAILFLAVLHAEIMLLPA
jgi:hypothetical protein